MIQTIAIGLLAIRLISVIFILLVLWRQFRLFSLSIDTGLAKFRVVMFLLGCTLLLNNILPIMVDIHYGIIDPPSRAHPLLINYAISNASFALSASIILWYVYRIVGMDLDQQQQTVDNQSTRGKRNGKKTNP